MWPQRSQPYIRRLELQKLLPEKSVSLHKPLFIIHYLHVGSKAARLCFPSGAGTRHCPCWGPHPSRRSWEIISY